MWFKLLNDYKKMGGRVTVSDDAAYIYNTWGFGYIHEMTLLQEAGFHPLEVIRAATMHGAEALHDPKGVEPAVRDRPRRHAGRSRAGRSEPAAEPDGAVRHGPVRLNDRTGRNERVGGIRYTIKDGIVYDAKKLLADVAAMVEAQKKQRSATSSR